MNSAKETNILNLFPIGREYSVSSNGRLYFNGEPVECSGNHSYGVYIKMVSFVEIKGKNVSTRYVDFDVDSYWSACKKRVTFEENSPCFKNLDWTAYQRELRMFLFGKGKKANMEMKKVKTYFK